MNETYDVNVTAPLMLTKAVLPLMKQAARTRKAEGKEDLKPLVVNMGSILGSIHNNDGRGEGKGKMLLLKCVGYCSLLRWWNLRISQQQERPEHAHPVAQPGSRSVSHARHIHTSWLGQD